jgi:aquaporin Z
MLWVFNRLDSIKAALLLGCQFFGAVLAGMCLRFTFETHDVLQSARMGAPHLNPLVYPVLDNATLAAGTGMELILTFFLVFAIFGVVWESSRPWQLGLAAGAATIAGVLVGFPLTGAALNPARWFGPVLWEMALGASLSGRGPMADVVVYVTGPVVGALAAGVVAFKVLPPSVATQPEPTKTSVLASLPAPPSKTRK